jgi:hypothetical protein
MVDDGSSVRIEPVRSVEHDFATPTRRRRPSAPRSMTGSTSSIVKQPTRSRCCPLPPQTLVLNLRALKRPAAAECECARTNANRRPTLVSVGHAGWLAMPTPRGGRSLQSRHATRTPGQETTTLPRWSARCAATTPALERRFEGGGVVDDRSAAIDSWRRTTQKRVHDRACCCSDKRGFRRRDRVTLEVPDL